MTNFPLEEQLTRIKQNLITLQDAYYKYTTTPKIPNSLENLTIYVINDVEKILYDLQKSITNMQDDFKHCGLLNCGGGSI